MIIYGVGMPPLTTALKRNVPDCNQPWYADDAGNVSSFTNITKFYKLLSEKGPARVYFSEPTKTIVVVKPESLERTTIRKPRKNV